MKKLVVGALLVVSLAAVNSAQAQVFTPTYTSPRLLNEIGLYVSDGPGDLGLEAIWRGGPLGLRVGYVDAAGGLLALGGELRSPLPVVDAPLSLAFTAGAQALFGDADAVGFHVGLTAGYTFIPGSASFTPYLHPRIGVVDELGGDSSFEVKPLADLGIDVEFYNNILIRFGVSLGEVGADWGAGVGIRR